MRIILYLFLWLLASERWYFGNLVFEWKERTLERPGADLMARCDSRAGRLMFWLFIAVVLRRCRWTLASLFLMDWFDLLRIWRATMLLVQWRLPLEQITSGQRLFRSVIHTFMAPSQTYFFILLSISDLIYTSLWWARLRYLCSFHCHRYRKSNAFFFLFFFFRF